MLQLTSTRIAASRDDLQRIQNIVISAPRLYSPQEFPNVQGLVYHVLSKPYKAVSRFGIFPSETQEPSLSTSISKDPFIDFHEDKIIGRIPVFNENHGLKGILEVKMMASDFKAFLGEMRTMSFTPMFSAQTPLPFYKVPFALYHKPPDFFWDFAFDNRSRYSLFFFYTLIVFALFVSCTFCLRRHFHKNYGQQIETLKETLEKTTMTEEELTEKLLLAQQKYKSCWTSFQAYKKIYANLNSEKQAQALQICKGLDAVIQGFKGGKVYYSSAQQYELLQSCAKLSHLLSEGRILLKRREPVNFANLFDGVSALFADKMYKSQTRIEITCPDDLCFYGDPLLIELILMNVVGKAIYRLSKTGKVWITLNKQEDTISFESKDKGFDADEASEAAFKKSFDLFVSENILKRMCHENDIQYISLKNEEDFNITKIIIPKVPLENSANNIVKLFQ